MRVLLVERKLVRGELIFRLSGTIVYCQLVDLTLIRVGCWNRPDASDAGGRVATRNQIIECRRRDGVCRGVVVVASLVGPRFHRLSQIEELVSRIVELPNNAES